MVFFFSSRRRHTRLTCDWSSDVCSSDLVRCGSGEERPAGRDRVRSAVGAEPRRCLGRERERVHEHVAAAALAEQPLELEDRKSTRLNSSHMSISYAVFCLKKKINESATS